MQGEHQEHDPGKGTALFRFYEELNDFLPRSRRKKAFPHEFTGRPTLREMIAVLGVPHPAIDLILVDGTPVGFDYRLQGGEYVSVYPVFESFDIAPLVRPHPRPLRALTFVAEGSLDILARELRLRGFDAVCRKDFTGRELIECSLREHRIILTRDPHILSQPAVTRGYRVRHTDPKAQLKEVMTRFQLGKSSRPAARERS